MWVEFVFCCLNSPLLREVLLRQSGFFLSSKTNTSEFQLILERKDTFKEFLRIPKCFVGKQITVYSLAKFNTYILHPRPF